MAKNQADEESRKYHKIIPRSEEHHHPGYKYLESNTSKWRHDAKKRKREEIHQKKLKASTIQRAKPLTQPSNYSITIRSELGYDKPARIIQDRVQAYIDGLEQHKSFDMLSTKEIPGDRGQSINHFDYDYKTGALVFGLGHLYHPRYSTHTIMPRWTRVNEQTPLTSERFQCRQRQTTYHFDDLCEVEPCPSRLSCIALDSSTRLFVWATMGSTEHPSINITYLLDPEDAVCGEDLDCSCTNKFTLADVGTIFCGAINHAASDEDLQYLAFGTSGMRTNVSPRGILIMDNLSGLTKWKVSYQVEVQSDVVAIDWLDAHVLVAGCRDGSVILHDVRTQGSVKRMKHNVGILNIRRAHNANSFIIVGNNNRTSLYDLRTLGAEDAAKSLKSHITQMKPARPVVRSKVSNALYEPLGFDVCHELDLVAAGEHDGFVRVSHLRTGQVVKVWEIPCKSGNEKEKHTIKCIRWVNDPAGTIKLMVSFGAAIWKHVW